jgi:hypothetical protein
MTTFLLPIVVFIAEGVVVYFGRSIIFIVDAVSLIIEFI